MKQFNLEEYLANPSRKVVTREGKDARIICTDRKLDGYVRSYPIVALVSEDASIENVYVYTEDGRKNAGSDGLNDLFFAPEKHEGWINIYKWGDDYRYTGDVFSSKEKALKSVKGCDSVATIKIEWEE